VVTFTVTQAFSSFSLNERLHFGDNTFYDISDAEFNNNVIAGQVAQGQVFISRVIVQKTYSNEGPFTAFIQRCCRINGLQNISGSYVFPTIVDLRDGNRGSPVSGAPVVLQMVQGGLNTASLSVSHPQGRPVTSRLATATEMGASNYTAPPGLTIDPATSLLSWDTSGTSIGQLWQVGVVVEKAGSNTSSTKLDFIIEIVDGTLNQPPTITGSVAEGSSHVVPVGQTFTVTVEGDDPDGDDLTINHLGLPSGATLTPTAGSTGPSPFPAEFSWTPQLQHLGTSHSVTISFTDPGGLDRNFSFSIVVPDNNPPEVHCPTPIVAECLNGEAEVTLAATVFDADGDVLDVTWEIDGQAVQTEVAEDGDTVFLTAFFPLGQSIVSIMVSDGLETHSCSTTVTVEDTVAPIIICAPNIVVGNDEGICSATLNHLPEPMVFDDCDEEPTLTNDAPEDLVFPHGTTEVTWTATDAAGNSATCVQTVTVEDREAPVVLETPQDMVVPVDFGECFATVPLVPPVVADNCDPEPTITSNSPAVFNVGPRTVEWIVEDASGNQTLVYQQVLVVNMPPVADAGDDQYVQCTSHLGAEVTLDGTGSYDDDGHALSYFWAAANIVFDDPASATPTAMFPIGATTVTLIVTDQCGAEDTTDVIVIVEKDAPTIEIMETSHHTLWPPNHQMVRVELWITVSDECAFPQDLLVSVVARSDQPDDSTGDGAFTGDVDGHDGYQDDVPVEMEWNSATGRWDGSLELRAERSGQNKNGRKYSFHCLAADHHGNVSEATACVLVPHNQGRNGR